MPPRQLAVEPAESSASQESADDDDGDDDGPSLSFSLSATMTTMKDIIAEIGGAGALLGEGSSVDHSQ